MEWTSIVDCAYDATIYINTIETNKYPLNIQLKDFAGNNLKVPAAIRAYITTDADGQVVTDCNTELATTSSGGGDVIVLLTKYHYMLISEADGSIDVDFEESDSTDRYFVLVMPDGRLVVSGILTYSS